MCNAKFYHVLKTHHARATDTRGMLPEQRSQLSSIDPLSNKEGKTVDYAPNGSGIARPVQSGGSLSQVLANGIASNAASSAGRVIA